MLVIVWLLAKEFFKLVVYIQPAYKQTLLRLIVVEPVCLPKVSPSFCWTSESVGSSYCED